MDAFCLSKSGVSGKLSELSLLSSICAYLDRIKKQHFIKKYTFSSADFSKFCNH